MVDRHPNRILRPARIEQRAAALRYQGARAGLGESLVDAFPYGVVYRILTDDIVEIVAVMHDKQRPDYWKDRR